MGAAMTDRELMQQALDALESECDATKSWIAEALRARLKQPEQPQIVWIDNKQTGNFLNMAPPQREWIGLTENEIKHLWYEACQTNLELTSQLIVHLARNIEAKLKAKNG